MNLELLIGGIVIYFIGLLGISYYIGRSKPYYNDNPEDFFIPILWPIILGTIPLWGSFMLLIKGLDYIKELGSKHTLAKRRQQEEQQAMEQSIANTEFFEDEHTTST